MVLDSEDAPHEEQVLLNFRKVEATIHLDTSKGNGAHHESSKGLLITSGDLKPVTVTGREPKDSFAGVYLIFLLHGVGVLTSWNMFITASNYFLGYKLNPETADVTIRDSVGHAHDNFFSYVGLCAQIPNVIFNAINLFVRTKSNNMTLRVVLMILIEMGVFIFTIVMVTMDSTTWGDIFFLLTLTSVVVMNAANGVYQSAIYGAAAKLPMTYSNAVVLGSNLSGALTSVISILSIYISTDPVTSALYYFSITLCVLVLCLISYVYLPMNKFYKHHQLQVEESGSTINTSDYLPVVKTIWVQLLNIFMVFFVTLACFPTVLAGVKTVGDFALDDKYFSPVACYLLFNCATFFGTLMSNWIRFPGPKYMWIPVWVRTLFIPFFLLCNYSVTGRTMMVLFNSDYLFAIGSVLLGFTSGYYSSLIMMYSPKLVDPDKSSIAAMMATFALVLGIFVGVNFSFIFKYLVTYSPSSS